MLVLSRRVNERIVFPDFRTAVQVVALGGGKVRLGIAAPREVQVLREELQERPGQRAGGVAGSGAPSAPPPTHDLTRAVGRRLEVVSRGLELLRGHLPADLSPDASSVLAELEDELRLLQERLRGEAGLAPVAPARGRRALLVEDNANERELLARCLRWQSVEVDTAGDGADALDYLRSRGRPDVLLLDMGLPRCDGPTTVRAIRRDSAYTGLKIFAVSGHAAAEYDLPAGPAGVDRWFQKPVDPAELVSQLAVELETSGTSA